MSPAGVHLYRLLALICVESARARLAQIAAGTDEPREADILVADLLDAAYDLLAGNDP